MLYEFPAHADAGVPDREHIAAPARRRLRQLRGPDLDGPQGRGELHGVGHHVQQHLLQPQPVADHSFVRHRRGIDREVEMLGVYLCLYDGVQVVQELVEAAWCRLNAGFAALDAAHVQHVVDKAEQEAGGLADLRQIVPHQRRVVRVGGGQGGEAHDSVHRRTDIVGHIVEKDGLGPVGPVGLLQGVLQQPVLGLQLLL